MPVQFRARCLGLPLTLCLANVPSRPVVWRGPAPKIQVMPSERPSGWHEPQLPKALPVSVGALSGAMFVEFPDQRPSPV